MRRKKQAIKVLGQDCDCVHLNTPMNSILTLCGFCDVDYEETDAKVDCPACLDIIDHCKGFNAWNKKKVTP